MAAATKWRSFNAEFFKSQFSRSKQTPKTLPQKRFADIRGLHGAGRRGVCPIHDFALDAGCAGGANGLYWSDCHRLGAGVNCGRRTDVRLRRRCSQTNFVGRDLRRGHGSRGRELHVLAIPIVPKQPFSRKVSKTWNADSIPSFAR